MPATKEQVNEACQAGRIIHLFCDFANKNKFLVIVQTDPLWLLVINTSIHPYIQRNAPLLACQVDIDCATHAFLDHDSHIDCSKIIDAIDLDRAQLILTHNISNAKGEVSNPVKTNIIQAVNGSPLLSDKEKAIISANLV